MTAFEGLGMETSHADTNSREGFYAGNVAGAIALIVEDDSNNAYALSALLTRGSMTVVRAESGPDALDILTQRDDIGIVLMDIMMPVMDGYETMTTMRKRIQSAELPIIAVTGKADDGERERCIAAGASAYIPKPVDTAALLNAISHCLPAPTPDAPRP